MNIIRGIAVFMAMVIVLGVIRMGAQVALTGDWPWDDDSASSTISNTFPDAPQWWRDCATEWVVANDWTPERDDRATDEEVEAAADGLTRTCGGY